jgi:anthranilate synthase component 1
MTITADGRASVQAGGGIVADSVPETEEQESRNKAAALLAAVPAARRMRSEDRSDQDDNAGSRLVTGA